MLVSSSCMLPAVSGTIRGAHPHAQVHDALTAQLLPGCCFRGHAGLVYDMSWSPDSALLATCSTDCTTRVWHIAERLHQQASVTDVLDTTLTVKREAASVACCLTINHASFAYACQFRPGGQGHLNGDESATSFAYVLAVADASTAVAIWQIDFDDGGELTAEQVVASDGISVKAGTLQVPTGGTALVWDTLSAHDGEVSETQARRSQQLFSGATSTPFVVHRRDALYVACICTTLDADSHL